MHRLIILLIVGVVIYMYCTKCVSTCRENYNGSNICVKIRKKYPNSDINQYCRAAISSTQSTHQHVHQKTVGEYFTDVLTKCYNRSNSDSSLKNCVQSSTSQYT